MQMNPNVVVTDRPNGHRRAEHPEALVLAGEAESPAGFWVVKPAGCRIVAVLLPIGLTGPQRELVEDLVGMSDLTSSTFLANRWGMQRVWVLASWARELMEATDGQPPRPTATFLAFAGGAL